VTVSTDRNRYKPIFDLNPTTGVSIEVFYADRSLETFGWCGTGWFWWPRRRGFSPGGPATGPFATRFAAYRHALRAANYPEFHGPRSLVATGLQR